MKMLMSVLLGLSVVACSTSSPRKVQGGPGAAGSGGSSGAAGATANGGQGGDTTPGAGTAGAAGDTSGAAGATGGSAADASGVAGAGAAGAGVAGAGAAGAAGAGAAGSGGGGGSVAVDAGLPPGAPNNVPTGYTGTPFKTLTIPGIIYGADYDKGGAGVGFCHSANVTSVADCAGGIKLNDWCCGNNKGCDERTMPAVCPIYRADADNAGLSHMNSAEPDNWAATGPTWVEGANGPTLTGPVATVMTPVPQDANTTMTQDAYISYMHTGQWSQYTVQVLAAGTYSIGGVYGTPAGTTISFDFGNGVTSGTIMVPASPTPQTEAYHEWYTVSNIGQVTFPAAGTYLMRFNLLTQQLNPLYFTFSKM